MHPLYPGALSITRCSLISCSSSCLERGRVRHFSAVDAADLHIAELSDAQARCMFCKAGVRAIVMYRKRSWCWAQDARAGRWTLMSGKNRVGIDRAIVETRRQQSLWARLPFAEIQGIDVGCDARYELSLVKGLKARLVGKVQYLDHLASSAYQTTTNTRYRKFVLYNATPVSAPICTPISS